MKSFLLGLFLVFSGTPSVLKAASAIGSEQWAVFETSFTSDQKYGNPFLDLQVDVVFRNGSQKWLVPAFWAGGDKWTVRFAPPVKGDYTFQVKCSDPANRVLNGAPQALHVTAYTGDNPLLKHGFLRVAGDKRHFEHADGTPFLWLADTWWKCLGKRMTWEGFQELSADRRIKHLADAWNGAGDRRRMGASAGWWREHTGTGGTRRLQAALAEPDCPLRCLAHGLDRRR
ncbi:MAG: DUF5060 domain-containing protein [Bacteroidia bacterium]|nr:DUF5060 domain-containing protein [Bacteroidia bacterium]